MPGAAATAGTGAAGHAISLTQQLRRGFPWMRFEPALEAAWRIDQFQDGVRFLRVSIVILAGVLLVLFQVDHGVMPEITGRMPVTARFGIMVPTLAVAMPAPQLIHYSCVLLVSSTICAMGAYRLEHARRVAWLEGQLLAEAALLDGLTGIHNRRWLDEHLQRVWQQCVREHKPIALLFGDIDHFKPYNDRYGHQAGDEALKAVAAAGHRSPLRRRRVRGRAVRHDA